MSVSAESISGRPPAGAPLDLVAHAPIPMLHLSPDGWILGAGRPVAALLGRHHDDLCGTSVLDLIDPLDARILASELEILHRDPAAEIAPLVIALNTGSKIGELVDAHLSAAPDGTLLLALIAHPVARTGRGASHAEQQAFRTALLELSELSHERIDDSEFFDALLDRAIEVVPGAQAGSVLVRDPGTDVFQFVAAHGFDLEGLRRHGLKTEDMFRDVENPSATINRDFEIGHLDPEIAQWLVDIGRILEIRSNVAAPVFAADGEPVAFISLDNFEDRWAFTSTSVEMTTVLGRLVADLLRRRALEAELRRERESFRHLALHDQLTGIANRRHLEESLDAALAGARRRRESVTVLFVDLDDLKIVNDRDGHETGDLLLVAAATSMREVVRAADVVGRWGGDEFVVIASNLSGPDDAEDLAQRIIGDFATRTARADALPPNGTLSIGVAFSVDGSEDSADLLRRADGTLYEAKASGKGSVRVSTG